MNRSGSFKKGFTLIEILIVVIVLGILGMIVIPQIRPNIEDARMSTLTTNLSSLRQAVDLYYIQHDSTYPGVRDITGNVTADAAAAATAFVQQLTRYTETDGTVSAVKTADARFGPYLKGGSLPPNPFNDNNEVVCDVAEDDITVRVSSGTKGWKFYTQTGVLIADDGDHDNL